MIRHMPSISGSKSCYLCSVWTESSLHLEWCIHLSSCNFKSLQNFRNMKEVLVMINFNTDNIGVWQCTLVIPVTKEMKAGGSWIWINRAKVIEPLSQKQNAHRRAGGMAPLVEHLSIMPNALDSIPSTTNNWTKADTACYESMEIFCSIWIIFYWQGRLDGVSGHLILVLERWCEDCLKLKAC
jgi:hypothetical protein